MPVTVMIPTALRRFTKDQATLEVGGTATVGEAMTALVGQFPDLRAHLYDEQGKLRSFVNIYLNNEDIRYINKDASALRDGDTLMIVPSIAGGAR